MAEGAIDISGLESLCGDCPARRVGEVGLAELTRIGVSTAEIPAMTATVLGKLLWLAELDRAAEEIDCRNQPKTLPPTPEPLPPIGHPDRIAYSENCPAWVHMKKAS
jgi:hypothetical protein